MIDLGIVDAGIGNVGSVANMCRRLGAAPAVIADPADVGRAARLILPGVGAWDHACERLHETGLATALTAAAQAGTPVLGICLGMQLLFERSEEGTLPGLGWLAGDVCRLPTHTRLGEVRIPHMGWSTLEFTGAHPVFADLPSSGRYYFVHSYAAVPADPTTVIATADYGEPFVAVAGRANVVGTQFHPEKSHRHGKAMLSAFLRGAPVGAEVG